MPSWTIGIAILLGLILLLAIFFWQFRNLQSSAKQSSVKQSKHQRRQPTIKLQNKLLRLLSGDRAAAMRLVERVKQRHPGKSEEWYWEKAIEDLERDRR
ncbi:MULTISPECIES: hypothetical protein [unclassified Coleofasciculus]|uniref:hypothetical protein n=1 Tax=Cyanophyceae TaxID=3028117 RepID=UPI0016870778|nr:MULTISPECIES: hypothetical protein [unclassified Coleofasciculus]MBD2085787.1 hypothetical protein [Coleofasciculus sp. FACHB-542]MBD2539860.1 hypothetical protein [Coleofasciculus sp. FACHB-SPT36]MBD2741265.1 hypothetical protein [Coleofasciculus sp. FACHB-1120]